MPHNMSDLSESLLVSIFSFMASHSTAEGVAKMLERLYHKGRRKEKSHPSTAAILSGRRITGDEGIHEALPRGEDEIGGDGSDVLEEAGARSFCLAGMLPEGFQAVVCGSRASRKPDSAVRIVVLKF